MITGETVRQWLEHPMRPIAVIIVTLLIGLVTIWPAADEYLALRQYRAELTQSINLAQQDVDQLDRVQTKATELSGQLAGLQSLGMDEDRSHKFRRELVEMTRRTGCRLRHVRAESPRRRVWHKDDQPVGTANRKGDPTRFVLRTQAITLSVSGPVGSIHELLSEIHARGSCIHTRRLSLRPRDAEREEIILEIDLVLVNLEPGQEPTAA